MIAVPGSVGQRRRSGALVRLAFLCHRWIGITAAALFALLAITGPLLTHGDRLGFNDHFIANDALLVWYPGEPAGPPVGVATPAGWVLAIDGVVALDRRLIGRDFGVLTGAVATDDLLLIASAETVWLLSRDGSVIERLGSETLPGPVERLGLGPNGPVIDTPAGAFRSGDGYLTWVPTNDAGTAWSSVSAALPAEQQAWLHEAYRHQLVTWYRFIADIHSGRLFGTWGPWLMDAAAAAMLLMVATGFLNWWIVRR